MLKIKSFIIKLFGLRKVRQMSSNPEQNFNAGKADENNGFEQEKTANLR